MNESRINRRHEFVDGKMICPITGKEVASSFTDHSIEGMFNSCRHCNPENYEPLAISLRRIANARKQAEELIK